jgi:hypothetical protein
MAYHLRYSDYVTPTGPPNPASWVGPPGPPGPQGIQGEPGPMPEGGPFLPLTGGTVTGPVTFMAADWLTPMVNWPKPSTHVYVLSPFGRMAITGASNSLSSVGHTSPVPIGVSGFGYNDLVGDNTVAAWGGYFEARQYPGALGYTMGVEINAANVSGVDASPSSPYGLVNPVTMGINLQSGGDAAAGVPSIVPKHASIGIYIGDNGARFQNGILFKATALVGTDGTGSGRGSAIRLATNHAIEWTKPDNTLGPTIVSNQTTGTAPVLAFENGALRLGSGDLAIDGGNIGLIGNHQVWWYVPGGTSSPGVMNQQTSGSAAQLIFANNHGYLNDGTLGIPLVGAAAGVPVAGSTALLLRVNNNAGSSYVSVIMGPPDSAGSGYRTLRVLN